MKVFYTVYVGSSQVVDWYLDHYVLSSGDDTPLELESLTEIRKLCDIIRKDSFNDGTPIKVYKTELVLEV